MDTNTTRCRMSARSLTAVIIAAVLALPACAATAESRSPTAVEMPHALQGVWRMGEAPCNVPHPDGDGVLTIIDNGWQGYEHRASLRSVASMSSVPARWRIVAEEVYLGSQHDLVESTFELTGSRLIIHEGKTVEVYSRCGRAQ